MPIYEYAVVEGHEGCAHCRAPFEILQRLADPPLERCPQCNEPVRRQISAPAVGSSNSGLDDRAKNAGFHKLKKLGTGEYEKKY